MQAKAARIKGVLVSLPASWYEAALSACGFERVAVLWSRFNFVTWVAHKPQRLESSL